MKRALFIFLFLAGTIAYAEDDLHLTCGSAGFYNGGLNIFSDFYPDGSMIISVSGGSVIGYMPWAVEKAAIAAEHIGDDCVLHFTLPNNKQKFKLDMIFHDWATAIQPGAHISVQHPNVKFYMLVYGNVLDSENVPFSESNTEHPFVGTTLFEQREASFAEQYDPRLSCSISAVIVEGLCRKK